MSIHDAVLQRKEDVADRTTAFHFSRPPGFSFKAGQAIDVVLPGPREGEPGERHTFSLVSAPDADELVIATRMRDSAFKRALGALPIGSKVQVDGPFGSLTLHRDGSRPAVFIAGGIGITPFMSMLRQGAAVADARMFTLIYANRRPEDAAFLDELTALAQRDQRFRVVATMTRASESTRPWTGERRAIDADMIATAVRMEARPVFYVAGPPAMVEAMRETLERAGMSEDDIRSEEFFGY
jgi:ferredoxin-NADP reductase